MPNEWNGQRYNMDWVPIDAEGNATGEKDWQANREWAEANDPQGAWNFSPDIKSRHPVAWDQTAQGVAQRWDPNPTGNGIKGGGSTANAAAAEAAGTGGTGGGATNFDWGGWDVGVNANQATTGAQQGGVQGAGGGAQQGGGAQMATSQQWNQGVGNNQYQRTAEGDAALNVARQRSAADEAALAAAKANGTGGYNGTDRATMDLQSMNQNATGGQGTSASGNWQQNAGTTQSGGGYDDATGNVAPPTLGGGGYDAAQMDQAELLRQLGAAPRIEQAGALSGFGSDVQESIRRGLADPRVDPTDPNYVAQVDAFRRNEQRSADRQRAAMAQRANAGGTLGSGGFDASVRRTLADQGGREADFEAQLMQSELAAGRDRQGRAQQLGAGLFEGEQSRGLQERLANQSGALQTMGFQNQRDIANLGAQTQTGIANLGARTANQGLNSQRDLALMDAQQRAALGNQSNATNRYGINTQAKTAAEALAQQGRISNNDLTLRRNALMLQERLGLGDLDLRKLGLTNQDKQYYAGLGQQLGLSQAELNQRAMLGLLGR